MFTRSLKTPYNEGMSHNRPSPKVRHARDRHVKERAHLRYGLEFSGKDLHALAELVRKGKGTFVERRSNSRSLWVVTYQGTEIVVAYSKTSKQVVTVLPMDYLAKIKPSNNKGTMLTLNNIPPPQFRPHSQSVLQHWVEGLPFMQQSVLIAAVRGPDGIRKDHVAKLLLRWYRRCIMISAFERVSVLNPTYPGGGSFTGPSLSPQHGDTDQRSSRVLSWSEGKDLGKVLDCYLRSVDELPHHFQLHFMHAAEILGYKHPVESIREWWQLTYMRLVNDMHLFPETQEQMDTRLSDQEATWRAREEVTALGPVV